MTRRLRRTFVAAVACVFGIGGSYAAQAGPIPPEPTPPDEEPAGPPPDDAFSGPDISAGCPRLGAPIDPGLLASIGASQAVPTALVENAQLTGVGCAAHSEHGIVGIYLIFTQGDALGVEAILPAQTPGGQEFLGLRLADIGPVSQAQVGTMVIATANPVLAPLVEAASAAPNDLTPVSDVVAASSQGLASASAADGWRAPAHHGTWSKTRITDPSNSNNLGSRSSASQGADILIARFLNRTREVNARNTCESTAGSCFNVSSGYVYTPVGHQYFRSGCGRAGSHYFTGGEDDVHCIMIVALDGGSGIYATRT